MISLVRMHATLMSDVLLCLMVEFTANSTSCSVNAGDGFKLASAMQFMPSISGVPNFSRFTSSAFCFTCNFICYSLCKQRLSRCISAQTCAVFAVDRDSYAAGQRTHTFCAPIREGKVLSCRW